MLKVGSTATYKVRLKNDSAASTQIGFFLANAAGCGSYFTTTVKAGTVDVTAAAVSGALRDAGAGPGPVQGADGLDQVRRARAAELQADRSRVAYSKIGATLLVEVDAVLMVHAAA